MVKWPFQRLSDLQLGDKKVTLNHQVYTLDNETSFFMAQISRHFFHTLGCSEASEDRATWNEGTVFAWGPRTWMVPAHGSVIGSMAYFGYISPTYKWGIYFTYL